MGRFISQDPIGFESDVNFYRYVNGNPVNLDDPNGLDCNIQICVRPLQAFPRWLPWWLSPVNHVYLKIGNWTAGYQSDNKVYSQEIFPNKKYRKCFNVKRKQSGTLSNGSDCKCASCRDIIKCVKNEGTPGYAGYYHWLFHNCGDWAMGTLDKCCMEGKVPLHTYGPRI